MIRSYVLFGGKELRVDVSRADLSGLLADRANTIWVDTFEPSEAELASLGELFGFHPLTIEDFARPVDLPKLDEFPGYIFLCTHGMMLDEVGGEVRKVELDSCLGPNFLVTSHLEPSRSVNAVWERVRKNPQVLARGADFLLHAVLDIQVDHFVPLLDDLEERMERVEEAALSEASGPAVLEDILKIRRQVLTLRRSIAPEREVFARICHRDIEFISARALVYFRDVQDNVNRTYQLVETYRDVVAGLMEAYRSTISTRMNSIMHRLTLISTIFLPVTFLASVYGMNFRSMPGLRWDLGFGVALLVMGATAAGMLLFFRRKRWI